ncbi:MAG TPA: hypothetical protein VJ654_00965 [Noviherbaspirillum sp.]|nr:hypothetical protein [Noviherbaspirillum sp.]
MQIETIGKYQIHLIAEELPASNLWEPYVSIFKFDDELQDFSCVLEKRRVSEQGFSEYAEAIEAARRAGNALLETGQIH